MHHKNNKGLQVNEVLINDNSLKNWKKTQYGGYGNYAVNVSASAFGIFTGSQSGYGGGKA